MSEEEIRLNSIKFANENKKKIAVELISAYKPESDPVSYFMAGSAGAGKTEFSKSFANNLFRDTGHGLLRIDTDEFRDYFTGYTKSNSHIFQAAASVITEKVHDMALDKDLSFILDGTFSNYEKVVKNIERSLAKGRRVVVLFVYQDPRIAWEFTQAREKVEGRRITLEVFLDTFIRSRENVQKVVERFGETVKVFCIFKNYVDSSVDKIVRLEDVDKFEDMLGKWYDIDDIKKEICQ